MRGLRAKSEPGIEIETDILNKILRQAKENLFPFEREICTARSPIARPCPLFFAAFAFGLRRGGAEGVSTLITTQKKFRFCFVPDTYFNRIHFFILVRRDLTDRTLMSVGSSVSKLALKPFSAAELATRVRLCPRLPSLRSIQGALRELLAAEERYAGQISEVIRRDPGLTSRLLRLVNSAHFGLSDKVTNLEEAVFFVGVRQVRELAMMTPVIDDFKKLAGNSDSNWRQLWKHSIGTAMVTKELMMATTEPGDDLDYVAGLVHDVGWIVSGSLFPEHHQEILRLIPQSNGSARHIETDTLGCDHAHLGSLYLRTQELSPSLILAVQNHHTPAGAGARNRLAAAIQIADYFTNSIGLGHLGEGPTMLNTGWQDVSGWDILFPEGTEMNRNFAVKVLERTAENLPGMVDCLV